MFSLISFASLMALVLLLKLFSTCFFFYLISFVNKFPVCVSQSFNKVVSRVRGLSYSNVGGENTKLYWRPSRPSKSFCFGFRGEKQEKVCRWGLVLMM